jgi:hypothetical protein
MSNSSGVMGIQLGDKDIEQVTDFKHLGSSITFSDYSEKNYAPE